ncbi:hypothetical protein SAY87_024385 [Trapa incisa]|uniref:Uncharacterized protein n=1 Tax=Trapa incisa TaxID=236973 RepID=A0AAN7JFE3_9MYRT|nr:hypothetical protein SAY87_024385 [Trapa incisa]
MLEHVYGSFFVVGSCRRTSQGNRPLSAPILPKRLNHQRDWPLIFGLLVRQAVVVDGAGVTGGFGLFSRDSTDDGVQRCSEWPPPMLGRNGHLVGRISSLATHNKLDT